MSDKKFIIAVVLITIVIKIAIISAYFYLWLLPGNVDVIGPDGEGYSQEGWYISRVLAGEGPTCKAPTGEAVFRNFYRLPEHYKGRLPRYGERINGLITYSIGFLYLVFGYVPLLAKTFNIFASAVSSIIVYKIALELYDARAALAAFILFTFFPTIFIFSMTLLRDPFVILAVLSLIYALVFLRKRVDPAKIAIMLASLTFILLLRDEFFLVASFSTVVTILFNRNLMFKLVTLCAIILTVVLIMTSKTAVFKGIAYSPATLMSNIPAIVLSRNYTLYTAEGGRLVYKAFPQKYYDIYDKYASREDYFNSDEKITMAEFLRCLPGGIFHYLARPLPFARDGALHNLVSVYMLYWYAVMMLAIFGIFRTPLRASYPIIIYLLTTLVFTSMVDANEGILLRHRDAVACFFIIFASAAVSRIRLSYWKIKDAK